MELRGSHGGRLRVSRGKTCCERKHSRPRMTQTIPKQLDANAYQGIWGSTYLDLSEESEQKITGNGRVDKNKFVSAVLSNTLAQQFGVILFHDHVHVPMGQIKSLLDHSSSI